VEKKGKKQKSEAKDDEENKKDVQKVQIKVFGKVNKDEAIEKMAWAIIDDQKQVWKDRGIS